MRKSLIVFIILILSLCILPISSNAQGFVFETDPQEKIVEPGERIEIKLSINNIKDIEEGINTIVGYLEYEEGLFETIDFVGKDKWKVTYNDDKKSKLYGKFAITTLQNGILKDEQIATLNVKLKGNLPDGETEIKFKSISSSDGYNTIGEEDRSVKLIIKNIKSDIKNEEPKDDEPTENKTEEKVDKPQNIITGDKIFLYIGIIVIAVIVNCIILVILKKNKNNKNDKV